MNLDNIVTQIIAGVNQMEAVSWGAVMKFIVVGSFQLFVVCFIAWFFIKVLGLTIGK